MIALWIILGILGTYLSIGIFGLLILLSWKKSRDGIKQGLQGEDKMGFIFLIVGVVIWPWTVREASDLPEIMEVAFYRNLIKLTIWKTLS